MNMQKTRLFIHRPRVCPLLAIPWTGWYNLRKELRGVVKRKKQHPVFFRAICPNEERGKWKGSICIRKNNCGWLELGLLIVTIIWGSGFVVVKSATGSLEPAAIVALRFAIATILMCIVFFPRLKRIDKSCIKAGRSPDFCIFSPFIYKHWEQNTLQRGKMPF